jgi:hypothetical protein
VVCLPAHLISNGHGLHTQHSTARGQTLSAIVIEVLANSTSTAWLGLCDAAKLSSTFGGSIKQAVAGHYASLDGQHTCRMPVHIVAGLVEPHAAYTGLLLPTVTLVESSTSLCVCSSKVPVCSIVAGPYAVTVPVTLTLSSQQQYLHSRVK